MGLRFFDPLAAGAFPLGVWHRSPTQQIFDWDNVEPGQKLGPFEWIIESFEAAILCYQIEVRDLRFLPTSDKSAVEVHPFIACRASYNLFQAHYLVYERAFLDFEHVMWWYRPLIAGEMVTLSGEITNKYEKRGRYYLEWKTRCQDKESKLIFATAQKVASSQLNGIVNRPGQATPAPESTIDGELEQVEAREIYCYLAWSRRNPFPPHPNLHTDIEEARRSGLPGIVMPGAVLGGQIIQSIIEHCGEDFYSGRRVEFKLVRPIPTESRPILQMYRNIADNSLAFRLVDQGRILIVGSAGLAAEGRS